MPLNEEQERQFLAELETSGEAQVRITWEHGGFSPSVSNSVIKWLAGKERETKALSSSVATATERLARAAESANTRANIAIAIAVISMIVTAIGIFISYFEARPAP